MNDITSSLGDERADFVVKAKRAMPPSASVPLFFAGLFFLSMAGAGWVGISRLASVAPSLPLITPEAFVALFAFFGCAFLFWASLRLFASGPEFAGTPTRLVVKSRRFTRSIGWGEFSGDMAVKGNGDNGSIALRLKSQRFVASAGRYRGGRFIPQVVYIVGIPDAQSVSEMIRKRIASHSSSLGN